MPESPPPILQAIDLEKTFSTRGLLGRAQDGFKALDKVNLSVGPGEVVGLVGESGSGKTTFGRAVTRLLDLDAGVVQFDGQDLYGIPTSQLRKKRRDFQMLFQNPASTLHPRMTVRQVLSESLRLHRGLTGDELDAAIEDLLEKVQLPGRAGAYPGELSGGQQRRIGVARMLAAHPKFVVADEPTSGLDAVLKADIIDLLLEVRDSGVAYLIISHDLNVIQRACDRVAVMYRGRIVERLPAAAIEDDFHHPYTRELFAAAAQLRGDKTKHADIREASDEAPPKDGCAFLPRCPVAAEKPDLANARCRREIPALTEVRAGRVIACHDFEPPAQGV